MCGKEASSAIQNNIFGRLVIEPVLRSQDRKTRIKMLKITICLIFKGIESEK
jgi:hypothetical protein